MDYEKLMTPELFEKLLSNGEGYLIDYKKEQYLFDKNDFSAKGITDSKIIDEKKGEILKDVLAFANTERTFDAFILIGVEDLNDGEKQFFEAKHIDDAVLHQFINEKTNLPVKFEYKEIRYDGKLIGIFHIYKEQNGLIYAKNDFGKVRKNVIYFRDGSSTRDFSPDEVKEREEKIRNIKLLQPIFDVYVGFGGITSRNVTDVGIHIKNLGELIKDVKFIGLNEFEFITQGKQTLANNEIWHFKKDVDTSKYQLPFNKFPHQKLEPGGVSFKIEYTDRLDKSHSREFYYECGRTLADGTLKEITK